MSYLNILFNKFDINTHKKNFIDYLEVVILEDGTIEYAVPSHQRKLLSLCINDNISEADIVRKYLSSDGTMDLMTWLCKRTGAISVWTYYYIGNANMKQINALKKLKLNGLYKGSLYDKNNLYENLNYCDLII